ncbi:MAG: recombination mediator RecR [Bacteroidetes bacterium]|jgi:recombination protein RecR|nr:recombination mediator RecR [Bacteroidota bacterium]
MVQPVASSKVFEAAVDALAGLPGIGRKSAMRLALFLLKQDKERTTGLGSALIDLAENACFCKTCHNLSDTDLCLICANPIRKGKGLCVVEDLRDVLAIEATAQFHGLYHVLGGRISPMDGIAPSDLNIESLLNRIQLREFDEVILALSPTMEGDTTAYFLYRKLAEYSLRITTLARGVGFGDELEFADEVTLGRSILQRQPFEQTLRN